MTNLLLSLKNVFMTTWVLGLNDTKVTSGLESVKTFFCTVVTLIGAIVVIKNVMDFATGIQDRDSSSISSGIRGMVAGGIMAAVSVIIGLFT